MTGDTLKRMKSGTNTGQDHQGQCVSVPVGIPAEATPQRLVSVWYGASTNVLEK